MLDLKTKRVYFLHCLSLKNTDSIFSLLQIDIMSCKLLSGCCFTQKIVTWFLCYCCSIPHTLSHRVLRQHSCYPVVHCCSNWQARLHSCITPTSQGVSAGEHMCVCVVCVSVLYLTFTSVRAHMEHRCPVLPQFPYVSMSWLNML